MEIGKIPPEILNRIVLNPINHFAVKRKDVFLRPKTGEDCSAITFGEELCVVSADPITGAEQDIGYIAVHINCNDIASSGAEVVGILLTILLPEKSTEATLSDIMEGAYEAAKEIGIEILGGHTEVTSAVNKPIVSAAVIGRTDKNNFIATGGAKVGQDVIMTKCAGLEGTVILAKQYEEILSDNIEKNLIEKAKKMRGFLSVVKESNIAKNLGATAMHDVTEGGILGAVWEIADCSNTGIIVELDKIPVKEETKAICRVAQISPYELISSGSLIITAFEGEKIVKALQQQNIECAIIGSITEKEKQIIKNGKIQQLNQPKSDALYAVKFE
ncbi:AIR synthase family protein [Clostridium sp. MD294]|uniref:AIR synthase family protein n=1 Tax=Clostridium sp. MD294 TaxID=97138 RepID=UPI0002CA9B5E|nr:AIR synthase family protein [Clostridium sp. MD294]NDO46749.1 AIR synthase [Clostridium sp. MD294]USF28810.1 Thiamine-monophosphate kinase [Clostridium sp. MD294]